MDIDQTETKPTEKSTGKNENVTPSASGESAAKYPDMKLAQSIHKIIMMNNSNSNSSIIVDSSNLVDLTKDVLKQIVEEMENPSLYRYLKSVFDESNDMMDSTTSTAATELFTLSEDDLKKMQTENEKALQELEEKVEKAKENAGDMEVLDARLDVAKFAAKSLSKEEALDAYKKVIDLPKLSSGKTMDALMESSRLASFYNDINKNTELLKKVRRWEGEKNMTMNNYKCYHQLFSSLNIIYFPFLLFTDY